MWLLLYVSDIGPAESEPKPKPALYKTTVPWLPRQFLTIWKPLAYRGMDIIIKHNVNPFYENLIGICKELLCKMKMKHLKFMVEA